MDSLLFYRSVMPYMIGDPLDQPLVRLVGSLSACHGPKCDNLGIGFHHDHLMVKLIGSLSFVSVLSVIT